MGLNTDWFYSNCPKTRTLQRAFAERKDRSSMGDLLFLERWEICPLPGPAAALRVSQIRRANPELAAAIRRELDELQQRTPATYRLY
jgi:hypothetical protein